LTAALPAVIFLKNYLTKIEIQDYRNKRGKVFETASAAPIRKSIILSAYDNNNSQIVPA